MPDRVAALEWLLAKALTAWESVDHESADRFCAGHDLGPILSPLSWQRLRKFAVEQAPATGATGEGDDLAQARAAIREAAELIEIVHNSTECPETCPVAAFLALPAVQAARATREKRT